MVSARSASERRPFGMPVLRADDRFVAVLADAVAEQVADRLRGEVAEDGYLNPEAAGRYICVSRRRIHAALPPPDP